jgi:hypothetical protein
MQEITHTVTEANGEVKKVSGLEPLPYSEPIEGTDKMPKGQLLFAELFNAYRERLLLLGEMKSK